MGETNPPSVAHVGYDISPLSRVKFKFLTTRLTACVKIVHVCSYLKLIKNTILQHVYISNRKIFGRYRKLYLQIRFTT
jgi:hypothetical protein